MSDEKVVDLHIHLKTKVADSSDDFVEVCANIPLVFGEKEMIVFALPKTLYETPGVRDIVKDCARDIIMAFITSMGATVVGTEVRDLTIPVSERAN